MEDVTFAMLMEQIMALEEKLAQQGQWASAPVLVDPDTGLRYRVQVDANSVQEDTQLQVNQTLKIEKANK